MSPDKLSAVPADETSVALGASRQDPRRSSSHGPQRTLHGLPCAGKGKLTSCDDADVTEMCVPLPPTGILTADKARVLPADTAHVLPADKFGVGSPTFANYFGGLGPRSGMFGVRAQNL